MQKQLKLTPPTVSERELQRYVVQALQQRGYLVLQIGAFRVKNRCPSCGKTNPPRATGNTPGAPDLFVTRTDWPANTWVAIELKAPGGGVVSSEQRHLAQQQRILISDSLLEILEVLEKYHQTLSAPVRPL
jgi:hypothetical protein